jgi:hypothetical protein
MDVTVTTKPTGAISKTHPVRCGCGQGCIIIPTSFVSIQTHSQSLPQPPQKVQRKPPMCKPLTAQEKMQVHYYGTKVEQDMLDSLGLKNFTQYDPYDQINYRLISNLVMERKMLQDALKQKDLELESLKSYLSKCKCLGGNITFF